MVFNAQLDSPVVFLTAGILIFIVVLDKLLKPWTRRPKGGLYPPGPKPTLLIGNMLDLPMKDATKVYMEWGKLYQSDIIFASALGSHFLILNRQADADELLERRSKIYSDRPDRPITRIIGWDQWNVGLLPYGDSWRLHRKLLHQNFNQAAAKSHHPIQMAKTHGMLRVLLRSPDKFIDHAKMFATAIPMAMMYGYNVKSFDEPCITIVEEAIHLGTNLLLPGSTLVNSLPFLQLLPSFFPGAGYKIQAAEAKRKSEEAARLPLDFVRKSLEEGTAAPSIVGRFHEKKLALGASEDEEKAVHNLAYTTYAASIETTAEASITFIYVMATHPEIQAKAQTEIDRVVGSRRLPTFEDRKELPYIGAIYREVLRWQQALPHGIPHSSVADDYYKGYFIPKGTTVITNIWAMTRDEELYLDPYKFNPDRFIGSEGNLDTNDRVLAYGFGRRSCVGRHVASSTLWIMFANVLAAYSIRKARDEFGREIDIDDRYDDFGASIQKAPFRCSFTPRSESARRLIEQTAVE